MGFWIQLRLLLWKNFTFRKRQTVQLIIELLWPLFLFFILISVRQSHPPFEQHECHFPNKALPSAGTLPWIQGIICNVNNPCFQHATPGETPGNVGNFNQSIISRLFADAQKVLRHANQDRTLASFQQLLTVLNQLERKRSDLAAGIPIRDYLRPDQTLSQFLRKNASLPQNVVRDLMMAHLAPEQVVLASAGGSLKPLVCNKSRLAKVLSSANKNSFERMQQSLCAVPEETLEQAKRLFLTQVDLGKLLRDSLPSSPESMLEVMDAMEHFIQGMSSLLQEFSQVTSFRDFRDEVQWLTNAPTGGSPKLMFQAISRIVCGHPEAGGLRVPSLNWYEDNDYKLLFGRNSTDQKAISFDNSTPPHCKDLVRNLESNPISRIMWRGIKPLFIGKILYTPNTPTTWKIMKEVNRTFEELSLLREVRGSWAEIGPQIWKFLESSREVHLLQKMLRNPSVSELVDLQLNSSGWDAASVATFLSNGSAEPSSSAGYTWKRAYGEVDQMIHSLSKVIECVSLNKLEAVATEDVLVVRALELLEERQFWAGVVFQMNESETPDLQPHITYKIRMDIDDVTRTNKIKDRFWDPGPSADPFDDLRYIWGGFVYIQDLVEGALVRVLTGSDQKTGIYLQQMPYPCYVDDVFLRVLNRSLPLFMTLAWIYSVAMIIKGMVHEKEARLKETMKIMGLSNGILWVSWFISSFIPFLISSAFLILILKKGSILPYSDPSVVFLFLATFAIATIMQCFLISTFFSGANLAAACGGIIYFSLYLPYVLCVAWRDHVTYPLRIAASLLSPVAFGFGCEYFSLYEEQGIGIQWFNLGSSPVEGDAYNFNTSLFLMLFDAGLYGVATWYIEAVFPGQYGIPKPWFFLFLRSYWCGEPLPQNKLDFDACSMTKVHLEEEPTHLPLGVSIQNLVKVYRNGEKMAINGLSLNFYQGQITSFLGHNGAGKTTTMSILTGLFPPTSGTAYILGRDIFTEMDLIRKSLGMCPQHNVLFDSETPTPGAGPGLLIDSHNSVHTTRAVAEWGIRKLGLVNYADRPAGTYSGGNRRKLSTAIALIGCPAVVFLDEPTTGMDPKARRFLWNCILSVIKEGRCVVLTSHSMEECEALCTRMSIMVNGQFRCLGSVQHLKSRFGDGYTIVLRLCGLASDLPPVEEFMGASFPGCVLKERHPNMLQYQLPATHCSLAKIFSALTSNRQRLRIEDYSVSQTTLDQVFVNFAKDQSDEDQHTKAVPPDQPSEALQRHITSFLTDDTVKESIV
eukprot:gi/632979492/ref/XP_007906500.1/ PREDICTED: ATP-binding cassette sub-family A member 1-like [Callorhinchus milii]